MLKNQLEKYLTERKSSPEGKGVIELYPEEKEYAVKNEMLKEIEIADLNPLSRFAGAYIERGNKETEEFLAHESDEFLNEPIHYFKEKKVEFMYLESDWWEMIGVDAVSFENDDVFGTYDVMLGLKLQKKYDSVIRSYLTEAIQGEDGKYDLMFDANEGIWALNFALNGLEGFTDELTIGEAYNLIYGFLFKLAQWVEEKK